ncbi:MAG: shikimate kinase [Eggerthellaceae bacterium]|nr:shikimate kinase [Eggerthellaceae bacterium]
MTKDRSAKKSRPVAKSPAAGSRPMAKSPAAQKNYALKTPVFLVGFMGAGKTSIARKIARMCGLAAIDVDTYLERRIGKRIADVFAESGEEGFRALESEVLCELADKDPQLISCGGGVVMKSENRTLLKTRGCVVHLKVSADEAATRISNKATRPLFRDLEAARKISETRAPLYEEVARITIDTANKNVNAIASEVVAALKKEGVLCQSPK